MEMAVFIPIVAIIAGAAIILTWMNNRHERRKWNSLGGAPGERGARTLEMDNARLCETVGDLQARIAVLERITTDPAERTAREIERLR